MAFKRLKPILLKLQEPYTLDLQLSQKFVVLTTMSVEFLMRFFYISLCSGTASRPTDTKFFLHVPRVACALAPSILASRASL